MLSLVCTVADRRLCWIRPRGSAWSYRYGGQVLLSNQLLQPSRTFDLDLEIFLWAYTPSPGDVILDIGAGTGTEAVPLARLIGPQGKVIAVEAHPETAEILAQAGPANGLGNIEAVAAAVTDAPGTLRITDHLEAGTNTLFGDGTIDVTATTIDELVVAHGLDHVDFLKMNIEGAERLAVLGMETAAPIIDRLAISCHDFLGTEWGRTRSEVEGWLLDHGFEITRRADDPRPWARDYLYATRPGLDTGSPA